MADARAGIHIVVAEAGSHQFLYKVRFFICTPRRRYAADRVAAIFRLDALELRGSVAYRFIPAHFTPRVGNLGADHRLVDAVRVRRVADRKAPLDAGVTVVRMTILV